MICPKVLTMNLTVALEVHTRFIFSFRNSPVHILLMSCPKVFTMNLTVSHFHFTSLYPMGTIWNIPKYIKKRVRDRFKQALTGSLGKTRHILVCGLIGSWIGQVIDMIHILCMGRGNHNIDDISAIFWCSRFLHACLSQNFGRTTLWVGDLKFIHFVFSCQLLTNLIISHSCLDPIEIS